MSSPEPPRSARASGSHARGAFGFVVVALALLAPGAAADPLVLAMSGFLTAEGVLVETAPPAGSVDFPPATPPAAPEPLRFAIAAPVRFVPGGGFAVDLVVRAQSALVARDAEGNAFELTVEPGGRPVRVALEDPVLAPGATRSVAATVQAPGAEYAEGDVIELVVRPLMAALPSGALSVVVGPEGSRVHVPSMRVPTPADLRLQDTPLVEFVAGAEAFVPAQPGAVVDVLTVGHASVSAPAEPAWAPGATFVVLVGEEPDADAAAHQWPDRERRVAASHAFTVGDVLARVHPGLGVVVPVTGPAAVVRCVMNCPPGGFVMMLGTNASGEPTDRPSSLVPPPRDTRGIPVSEDAPPRETPALGAPVIATLILGLASWRRR